MKIHQLHPWNLSPKEAIKVQSQLVDQLKMCPCPEDIKLVAGADISFSKEDPRLFAVVVVIELSTLKVVEVQEGIGEATFPYIPGLLGFREIPLLCEVFEKVESKVDVVVCDGQGIAHPRKLGLASHLGLFLNLPTVGCAKKKLVGKFEPLNSNRWASSPLIYKNEIVGEVVRSREKINPLFISPGHKMDLFGAVSIVKHCTTRYKMPEPTRLAHLLVNRLRRQNCIAISQNNRV